MKKVSKITKLEIVDLYMDDTIKNGKLPKRVARFCEDNNIEIEDFNKHFVDFKSLEAYIFEVFYENTIQLLYANENFNDFEPQDKVLSFYYTFFELLTANRDFVKICLDSKNKFARILVYKDLREQYIHFVENINIEFISIPVAQINKAKDQAISNISWVKLMLTIEYWLNDKSPAFEKTDVLIEKSVQTAFQILDTTTMSSVFDLGKFLVKDIFPNKKK